MQQQSAQHGFPALTLLCSLQTRFATDERVYKAFLEILNMYRKGQKTITNVYDEVSSHTWQCNAACSYILAISLADPSC